MTPGADLVLDGAPYVRTAWAGMTGTEMELPANLKRTEVIDLDETRRQIDQATTASEVKGIRDKLAAFQRYAKDANFGHEEQNNIAETKVRAEWKCGHLLHDMAQTGARGKGRANKELRSATLSDLGIDKFESHRWEK